MTEKTIYSIEPTGQFPVYEGINYVIDLPIGEWGKCAVIRSENRLKDGDALRLPNGSWLEVIVSKGNCYGHDCNLFGLLKFVQQSTEIDNEINLKMDAGKVFKTEATYIA